MQFQLFIEKDQAGYYAHVPLLEGCQSQGDTYEETLHNIEEAIELYWETLSEDEKKEIQNRQTFTTALEIAL
jgi:predicted RNase H-like HicB family nuclease